MSRQEQQPNFFQRFIARNTSGWEWAGKDAAAQTEKTTHVELLSEPEVMSMVGQLRKYVGKFVSITNPDLGHTDGYTLKITGIKAVHDQGEVIAIVEGTHQVAKTVSGPQGESEQVFEYPVKLKVFEGAEVALAAEKPVRLTE